MEEPSGKFEQIKRFLRVDRCCFCVLLRDGTAFIGWVGLILAIINLSLAIRYTIFPIALYGELLTSFP